MGSLVFGAILLFIALILWIVANGRPHGPGQTITRLFSMAFVAFGAIAIVGSTVKVIDPGTVGCSTPSAP